MAEFSFDFTEGSFLQSNGQKHLRSVISKKEPNKFIKNGDYINSQANISQQVITLSDFYSVCENECQVMKTSSV